MDWFPALEACSGRTLNNSDLMFSMNGVYAGALACLVGQL